MKKLSFLEKVVYFLNTVAATVLLLSYVLPYVEPKNFSLLSVLSLAVPILIILNVLFLLFWLLKVKKQLILSLVVLFIGYLILPKLYKFSSYYSEKAEDTISLMNYNLRLFNIYKLIDNKDVELDIYNIFYNDIYFIFIIKLIKIFFCMYSI